MLQALNMFWHLKLFYPAINNVLIRIMRYLTAVWPFPH